LQVLWSFPTRRSSDLLTPQSIYKFGTYTVRAKEDAEAEKLKTDALMLEKAGCFALVLEKVPAKLAKEVAESLTIPVIGIGAGNRSEEHTSELQSREKL